VVGTSAFTQGQGLLCNIRVTQQHHSDFWAAHRLWKDKDKYGGQHRDGESVVAVDTVRGRFGTESEGRSTRVCWWSQCEQFKQRDSRISELDANQKDARQCPVGRLWRSG
jgi:hypothetical protein